MGLEGQETEVWGKREEANKRTKRTKHTRNTLANRNVSQHTTQHTLTNQTPTYLLWQTQLSVLESLSIHPRTNIDVRIEIEMD